MSRKYNFVIFGATNFIGKQMIREIAKVKYQESTSTSGSPPFTWAVAGRSVSKLTDVLREISNECGRDLTHTDKIMADTTIRISLKEMASQCDIVLNLVSPYMLHGEAVVKACVEEGTHHLDISAEDSFLEEMQLKYHKAAESSGSLIIGGTGFASLPSDFGAVFLERHFIGELNSVESYLEMNKGWKNLGGHILTWNTILLLMNRYSDLERLKSELYPFPYFDFEHKLSKWPIRYSKDVSAWCVPLPIPDTRVMERTQRYKFYEEGVRPAQTQLLFRHQRFIVAFMVFVGLNIFRFLVKWKIILWMFQAIFKCTRCLTIFSKKIISMNPFSRGNYKTRLPETLDGIRYSSITTNQRENSYTFTLIGKGWGKACGIVFGDNSVPPNKIVKLKVFSRNASGRDSVTMMLQAGLTILEEQLKMPKSGGVYTPGIAFSRTTLGERLNRNGITFDLEILPDPQHKNFDV